MSESSPFYRKILVDEFESRQKRNPSYSLRAFARDLGLQPSNISEILRGLSGLSIQAGTEIATRLQLSDEETQWFVRSIEAHHSRDLRRRQNAQAELAAITSRNGLNELDLERFKIIKDWYHFALLELTDTVGFSPDPAWIADRLKITEKETKEAIDRLIEFNLLERKKDGSLKQTRSTWVSGGVPSREIRKHHAQILQKAEGALSTVDIDSRDFSALTMAVPQSKLPEARKLIQEFRRQFVRLFETSTEPKDRVFILGVQFFPVDDPSTEDKAQS
ncbi:MAG: DUF4423 domain-containing protein [Bdellovibrionia bacterium]